MSNKIKDSQNFDNEQRIANFISRTTTSKLQTLADDVKIIKDKNGNPICKAGIVRQGDENIVFTPAEAGNGPSHGHLLRALFIAEEVYPESTVVFTPSATLRDPKTMNLPKGKSALDGAAENHLRIYDQFGKYGKLILQGFSQGASLSGRIAADPRTPEDTDALILEATNNIERSLLKLVIDFASSGTNLAQIKKDYFKYAKNYELEKSIIGELDLKSFAIFGAGLGVPANLAMFKDLRKDTLKADIEKAIKSGRTILHAWAKNGISHKSTNRQISQDMQKYENYKFIEFDKDPTGKSYDHSLTNDFSVIYDINQALKSDK